MSNSLINCISFAVEDEEENDDDIKQFTIVPTPTDVIRYVDSPLYGPSECLICLAEHLKTSFAIELEFEEALTNMKIAERLNDETMLLNVRYSMATADVKKWLLPPMKGLRDKQLHGNNMIAETIKKFERNALSICTDHFKNHPPQVSYILRSQHSSTAHNKI